MQRTIETYALDARRDRPESVRICEMLAGCHLNAIDLSIDEALDLAADITDEVANLRRGRIIDGLAWCPVCGRRTVPVSAQPAPCQRCQAGE